MRTVSKFLRPNRSWGSGQHNRSGSLLPLFPICNRAFLLRDGHLFRLPNAHLKTVFYFQSLNVVPGVLFKGFQNRGHCSILTAAAFFPDQSEEPYMTTSRPDLTTWFWQNKRPCSNSILISILSDPRRHSRSDRSVQIWRWSGLYGTTCNFPRLP